MGGFERGHKGVNGITPHSLFSLSWDEWASIIAILTAVILIIRWTLNKAHKQLFAPIYKAINQFKFSVDKLNIRLEKSEDRLEKEEKLFIRHDEELKDHERRITSLEERK